MGAQHGKDTVLTVAGRDISSFTTTSKLTRGGTTHGFTGYGKQDERNRGGLRKFTFTAEGWYDNTVGSGPHAVLSGQTMVTQAIVRRGEGTGTGKPQESFAAVLQEYVETAPYNDIVTWSASWVGDDAITDSIQ